MIRMVIYVFYAIIIFWLLTITWIVIQTRNHYFKLVTRTKKNKIDEILDKLLANGEKINFDTVNIKKELEKEIEKSRNYYQKIGLVRFNPFERVEGEQSFVIALLNNNNSGLVINFINTRDGLRVYTKKVKNGKGVEYDLSDEEKKAIERSEI